MEPNLSKQMLAASEIIYYAGKFFGDLFFFFFQSTEDFNNLSEDLELLRTAGLNCVVFSPISNEAKESYQISSFSKINKSKVKGFHLIGYNDNKISRIKTFSKMFATAKEHSVRKIFLITSDKGVYEDDKFYSTLTHAAFKSLNLTKTNIPSAYFNVIKKSGFSNEVVVLGNDTGSLFQETFTYMGSGTLVTDSFNEGVRLATQNDVRDILFLLKPYFKDKTILQMSRNEIIENINNFYVYHCNDRIVALASLKAYGSSYELGKIASLPRYQGQGRARVLIQKVIEKAFLERDAKEIFVLTTQEAMVKFLTQFEFKEVSKDKLPNSWKASYDFKRNSKALRLEKK